MNKKELHQLAVESLNEGLRLDDWPKIGCVNHDCDQCKAQQEPGRNHWEDGDVFERIGAMKKQPAQDNTYGYAKGLAESLFKKHYAHEEHYASGRIVWEVSDTTIGLLTQIDNMVCTLVRPAEQSAREWVGLTDEDGIEYPYPPAKPPIYATANNTKAVRDGFEMGGYEKEAGYYSEAQLDEFAQAIEAKLKEKNT